MTLTRAPIDLRPAPAAVTELHPDEAAPFGAELDRWLRPGAEVPSAADLPLLVAPGAPSTRFVVRDRGRIVSHAALFVHRYRAGARELRIGVVGAVATAPDARGRGHAGLLVDHLEARAAAEGLDVVVLWDDTPGGTLYARHGFVRAGREVLHLAWPDVMHGLVRPGWVRGFHPSDLDELRALHDRESAATIRDRTTWETLLGAPRTHTYVLDRDGTIEAYGVVGKGVDLLGCLHEWGGEPCALPALVSGIFRLRPLDDRLTVMSPPWHETAHRALEFHGLQRTEGILGMVWMPDPAALGARLGLSATDPEALCDEIPLYLKGLDSM